MELGGSALLDIACFFLARNVLGGVRGWKFLASCVEFLDEFPRWNFAAGGGSFLFPSSCGKKIRWDFLGGVSWLAIPCFPLSWGKIA